MFISWIICGILFLIVLVLLLKNHLLKKSMDEISTELSVYLSEETNMLLSTSSRDKHIQAITTQLNTQLRLLRQQRQIYANGNRELKDALTNISHDLRTPLTAICGYLDLLEQEETSEEMTRYIRIIANRVDMLKQLTEELFRYSIILAYDKKANIEKVVLNSALEASIAEFYVSLKERNITPEIEIPETKVVRNLDYSALSRVFSNLLNNAMKYSDGDLHITLTPTGEITFSNTASSLNEVQVANLFDRFYTIETANHATGLGLAITRNLIEQMHGCVSAEYEDCKLSIRIVLPESKECV